MVHASFHFPSHILGRVTEFQVLLPRAQSLYVDSEISLHISEKKHLLFFHGIGDDGPAVLMHTDMAALCDELDLVVILPSVDNSFCLDLDESMRYQTWLTDELIPYTRRIFSLSSRREDCLIGGISMGGYGASSIALRHPELFSRLFCLSGALDLNSATRYARACGIPMPEVLRNRGRSRPVLPEDWNLSNLLDRSVSGNAELPEMLLICSQLDSVYRSNTAFAERAAGQGIPVELRTPPGMHDWSFWRTNLRQALEWATQKENR